MRSLSTYSTARLREILDKPEIIPIDMAHEVAVEAIAYEVRRRHRERPKPIPNQPHINSDQFADLYDPK